MKDEPCEKPWCVALASQGSDHCAVHRRDNNVSRLYAGSPFDNLNGGPTSEYIRQAYAAPIAVQPLFTRPWDRPTWLTKYGPPTDAGGSR